MRLGFVSSRSQHVTLGIRFSRKRVAFFHYPSARRRFSYCRHQLPSSHVEPLKSSVTRNDAYSFTAFFFSFTFVRRVATRVSIVKRLPCACRIFSVSGVRFICRHSIKIVKSVRTEFGFELVAYVHISRETLTCTLSSETLCQTVQEQDDFQFVEYVRTHELMTLMTICVLEKILNLSSIFVYKTKRSSQLEAFNVLNLINILN